MAPESALPTDRGGPRDTAADPPERLEWVMASEVIGHGYEPTPHEVRLLAAEVLRLRELAEIKYELLRSEKGWDVVDVLRPRIDKLYMALNAKARGDVNDLDGDPAEPWNRLVGLAATAVVRWVASERWAVLEHRAADDMRASLSMVSEGGPA